MYNQSAASHARRCFSSHHLLTGLNILKHEKNIKINGVGFIGRNCYCITRVNYCGFLLLFNLSSYYRGIHCFSWYVFNVCSDNIFRSRIMIPRKLKECSVCHDMVVLWQSSPAMCKNCSQLAKLSEKPTYDHSGLKQTADGRPAKPFKYRTQEIKKVSTRQQRLNAAYSAQRKVYLKYHPYCEAKLSVCTHKATTVHHRKGRGMYLLDESTWLPCCLECHTHIENSPVEAKALGLSESRLNKI
jgi:hypothetical protein